MANRVLEAKRLKIRKVRAEIRRNRPRFVWSRPKEVPGIIKLCADPLVYLHWEGINYWVTELNGHMFRTSVIYPSSDMAKWDWKTRRMIWESEINMLLTCAGCGKTLGQTQPRRSNSPSFTLCHKCKENKEAIERLAAHKLDPNHEDTECSSSTSNSPSKDLIKSRKTTSYRIGF